MLIIHIKNRCWKPTNMHATVAEFMWSHISYINNDSAAAESQGKPCIWMHSYDFGQERVARIIICFHTKEKQNQSFWAVKSEHIYRHIQHFEQTKFWWRNIRLSPYLKMKRQFWVEQVQVIWMSIIPKHHVQFSTATI